MMRFGLLIGILVMGVLPARAQVDSVRLAYRRALGQLVDLMRADGPRSFKKAVFVTENVYLGNSLDYDAFCSKIGQMAVLMRAWMLSNPLRGYGYEDSLEFERNFAVFTLMKDSVKVVDPKSGGSFSTIPMVYDFDDYEGAKDWTKMFVSKLLYTFSGNCHSLPYLYKILADELGASCWLSSAPNHLYIQNRCRKIGWYNTELTSGTFPVDGWIMASGYLPLRAVQSGIYMDTLSNREAIALCMLDLAKGYEHKMGNYYDGFILACCDSSLRYFPLNVQAILLKAETLRRVYQGEVVRDKVGAKALYREMEGWYVKLFDLGYREMPDKMYRDWLRSVQEAKYYNGQVRGVMNGR